MPNGNPEIAKYLHENHAHRIRAVFESEFPK
jgi:hypothetical protein